ncbi:MAG: hypothetical protein OEZ02_13240 [Anaerolineae bacterium]|nr:hypothetical protein [Anaerolineae bacterium]
MSKSNSEINSSSHSDQFSLWAGLVIGGLFTALIWWLAPLLDKVALLPDQGASWYYWKLPEPTFWTRATAWGFYAAHQISIWTLIYLAQSRKLKYSGRLHRINYIAFAVNAFFILLHVVQTHIWYDGLAQDVSIWSSQVSVAILLIWVILMENPRRGIFLGKRIPFSRRVIDFARKYHGYYFAWAAVYTFWYHPAVSTPGHLLGFFYMFMLFVQGSLFFTRIHLNRYWNFALELMVLVHAVVVAFFQGMGLWPMFAFGFGAIFIISQMHGLGLSKFHRSLLAVGFLLAALLVYNVRGWHRLYELVSIALIDYLGVFVLAALIALLLRIFPRLNKA